MSNGDRLEELTVALALERRRYHELFQHAPVSYLTTDADGLIDEANAPAGALFGLEPRVLSGRSLAGFVVPARRRDLEELLATLRLGEADGEHELEFAAPGGRFVASLAVVHVEGGSPGSLRWVLRDVTARRRAEEEARLLAAELERRVEARTRELDRERTLLDAVIQQLPAGVTITDVATGRLLIANAEAWEIARELFDPSDGLQPLLRTLGGRTEVSTYVFETIGPSGAPGAIEVHSAPVHDGEGNVTARVAVFRDVTARERLERAEREFVTNAAHELQTPLTAITSAAEVLQAGAKDTPADRDRFLLHIQQECDRLARLVRALLVLARAQSGGSTADAERLTLRSILVDVVTAMRPAGSVVIEVRCSPRLTVEANRDLLEQALLSLASNAVKYTSEGTIRLAGRRLDQGRVAVEVTDTGPGIASTERELVRQRFYRSAPRDRSGFGLGLAIAEQAATALGGLLELEDAPSGGTTARLVLRAGVRR